MAGRLSGAHALSISFGKSLKCEQSRALAYRIWALWLFDCQIVSDMGNTNRVLHYRHHFYCLDRVIRARTNISLTNTNIISTTPEKRNAFEKTAILHAHNILTEFKEPNSTVPENHTIKQEKYEVIQK